MRTKALIAGVAALLLATGAAYADKKPLTPKQAREYRLLISAGITKKDAERVVRDPGVKKGEWGWTCSDDKEAVRVKGGGVKYKNNVVCE
jgi:hypothetical protein